MEKPEQRGAWKFHLTLVIIQFVFSSGHVVMKSALDNGVNQFVFSTLRCLVAFVVLAIAGFFTERKIERPATPAVWGWLIFFGFTGVFATILFLVIGLKLTSPVYGAATQPLIPLFAFFLALFIGSETLQWRRLEGKVKVAGIFMCIAGAAIVTFYKGPQILGTLLNSSNENLVFGFLTSFHLGILCFLVNTFSMALYIVLQAPLLKIYPATITVTAWAYFFGTIFMGIVTCLVSPLSDWLLTPKEILSFVYMGVFASAFTFGAMTVCTPRVGSTMVALYIPIQLIASSVLSYFFLGSPLYLGSLLGGIVIVLGFYSVVWGRRRSHQLNNPKVPDEIQPLLHKDQAEQCV